MATKTLNFKLVLLGDTAVGKSSCVERFVKNEFFQFQQPTIGAAFLTQTITLDECVVKFEIWDTAGQERYRSLAPMYYRGASAALVVYDITAAESFQGSKQWIEELERQASSELIVGLAGNKTDLEDQRQVSKEEAQAFATEHGLLFAEMSAKTGDNVKDIFTQIARKLPKNVPEENTGAVQILDKGGKKKSCCKK